MDDIGSTVHRNRIAIAATSGAVVFLLLWLATVWGFFSSLIAGLVIFGLVWLAIGLIGRDEPATATSARPASAMPRATDAETSRTQTGGTTVPPTGGGAAGGTSPAATGTLDTGTPEAEVTPAPEDRLREERAAEIATANERASEPSRSDDSVTPTSPGAARAADAAQDTVAASTPTEPASPVIPVATAPETEDEAVAETRTEAEIGTRPATLDGPRDGGADDLKRIKGVGPKLEALCNRLGFWHFDQIAQWSDDEIDWVDQHLEGFNGRVRRDDWVAQARDLGGGGA